MRYIFIIFFLTFGISAFAQQNIVESLQRNRAGEGAVTIHQDPKITGLIGTIHTCLLYTSPSPRDGLLSRMPSSA